MFSVELCKTKAVLSAKPKKRIELDLGRVKQKFSVLLESPILLVIKSDFGEVVVHKYGELVFKDCSDVDKVSKLAELIYEVGYEGGCVIERWN
jgi:hypothetical protein